ILLLLVSVSPGVPAGVGDVTVRTSHPNYPGEGAFQTIEDCVRFAVGDETDPQVRALALYNWFLTHQWHLMSPMEWCVPGRVPDSRDPGDYETVLFDANRARFSFGYGLCGTVHAWNEPYWKAAGFPARRREFPNHVNSEIFYGQSWHAFDTDMAGLLFRPDGVVAGYSDIIGDPKLIESVRSGIPHYPFDWPADSETMQDGWKQVAERKTWYALYNGGYAAHPAIVRLRRGEEFTRWYNRDHFGGVSQRRFWQNQPGGPYRQWAYFGQQQPFHSGPESNARNPVSYCNGEFLYRVPVRSDAFREGAIRQTDNAAGRESSPALHSADGQQASVTFHHFSPYVICGDPEDDANPMSGPATDGLVVSGTAVGDVSAEVSANEGLSWIPAELASAGNDDSPAAFRIDLTEHVKGRYGWQFRLTFADSSGLDELTFVTTTQVSQAMYPRLTPNGTEITVRSKPRAVTAVLPDFGLPESQVGAFEEVRLRSSNLKYQPRSATQRYAYHATDNQPAHVVFKVVSPTALQEIAAAVRYQVPVPPTPGCRYVLELSADDGQSWSQIEEADVPADNEFSSGWLAGSAAVKAENCRSALIRFRMHSPGRPAALIDAQFYGVREAVTDADMIVEFGWLEGTHRRAHRAEFSGNRNELRFQILTGSQVRDEYVRFSVP
ncbi:MAG: hypothetical protein KDA89_17150, partial [Planctomycetaceae bacterium]|nr:hypothetical protein [Planctomycetaceae bacterium]